MNGTVVRSVDCPYCGETVELVVDTSVDHQAYVEDCSVCCRPIQLDVSIAGDDVFLVARNENEA